MVGFNIAIKLFFKSFRDEVNAEGTGTSTFAVGTANI